MTDSRPIVSAEDLERAAERDYSDVWDELEDVSARFAGVRPKKDRQLNLRVDDDLLTALRMAAGGVGESYHSFARRLIEEGVARALETGPAESRPSTSPPTPARRPFQVKEVLLVLLGQAGTSGHDNEPVEGRTRLQKLLFLTAQHLRGDIAGRFEAYDYGPFDEGMAPDLEFLASEGLVEWEGRTPEPADIGDEAERGARILDWVRSRAQDEPRPVESYRLTQLGLEWLRRFFASDAFGSDEVKQRLAEECRRLKEQFGRVPLDELVDHVYAEYPEAHRALEDPACGRRASRAAGVRAERGTQSLTDPLFEGRAPRLWLRLEQQADKPYYERMPPGMADGYILNANLVESAPEACASFLDHTGKPFLIDPITYRFDRPAWYTRPDAGGEAIGKRNYSRLWAEYSAGVGGLTGKPLADGGMSGLKDEEAIVRFCQNVLSFQDERLRSVWAQDGAQYVMDRLPFTGQLTPMAYVAPYGVIGTSDPGADIDLAGTLARATVALARPRRVVAVLPLMPRVLRDFARIRSLAGAVADSGVRVALVWTVGVSATDLADDPALFTGLALLLRDLRDAGLEAGLLYGGILTSLLRAFGAAGFSHALMYGEVRGIEPSRGRPPLSFYFPPLRKMLSYKAAEPLVIALSPAEYLERVCACALCRTLVGDGIRNLRAYFQTHRPDGANRDFPTQEALDLNRFHYLLARGDELAYARARSEGQLIRDMLAAADPFPEKASINLRRWAERLRAA